MDINKFKLKLNQFLHDNLDDVITAEEKKEISSFVRTTLHTRMFPLRDISVEVTVNGENIGTFTTKGRVPDDVMVKFSKVNKGSVVLKEVRI